MVPVTEDPAGIARTPPTDTELASVPLKPSPAFAVFELKPLVRVTDNVVPAGTTIGGGGGGGAGAGAGAGAAAGVLSVGAGAAFVTLGDAAGAGWLEAGCVAGSLAGAAAGCEAAACS